ncbi:MAG: hypothetical protein ACK47E_07355 [Cyclobacteriaceae bacterium]
MALRIVLVLVIFLNISYDLLGQDFEGEVRYRFQFADNTNKNDKVVEIMKIAQPEYVILYVKNDALKKISYLDSAYEFPSNSFTIWKNDKIYQINDKNKTVLASDRVSDLSVDRLSLSSQTERKIISGYECDLYTRLDAPFSYSYWISKDVNASITAGGFLFAGIGLVLEMKAESADFNLSFTAHSVIPRKVPNKIFNFPFDYELQKVKMPESSLFQIIQKTKPEDLNKEYKPN